MFSSSFNNEKVYLVNGIARPKSYVEELIISRLESDLPFASILQLSLSIKVGKDDVKEVLYDYIVKKAKENNITTLRDLSAGLKVKSDYIIDLIEVENRIVLLDSSIPADLIEIEKTAAELNKRIEAKIKRENAINGLNNAINSNSSLNNDPNPRKEVFNGYYTQIGDRNRGRFGRK